MTLNELIQSYRWSREWVEYHTDRGEHDLAESFARRRNQLLNEIAQRTNTPRH